MAEIERGATHNSILGPANEITWSPRRLEAERLIVARRVPAPDHGEGSICTPMTFAQGKLQGPIYKDSELSSIEAVPCSRASCSSVVLEHAELEG